MAIKLRPDLEERLKKVIKSKIIRLREAANDVPPIDDEEDEEEEEFDIEPTTDVEPAPEEDPAAAAVPSAPSPKLAPTAPSAPAEPTAEPEVNPQAELEPVMNNEPPADSQDSEQASIRRAKVKLFFDKLGKSPNLMNYLNFTSPLEQAEAIQQFAELVKVPRSQLLPLLKQIRTIAQEPTAAPQQESRRIQSKKKLLSETLIRENNYSGMTISQLASAIEADWKKVYFGAKPYLDAMYSLEKITDNYYEDSGRSVVAYFLSNATTWRGEVAKAVKAELNKRLKSR